jgi:hypothetical protein
LPVVVFVEKEGYELLGAKGTAEESKDLHRTILEEIVTEVLITLV